MDYHARAGPIACHGIPLAAGTVTNKSAAQRGRSPIYHFDVVAYNGKVAGKVTVNTANAQLPSYILVARGLTPNTKYTFGYTTPEEVYPLGSMDSPKAGALVIKGTFPLDAWTTCSRHSSG